MPPRYALSDSESDQELPSPPILPDDELENGLRDAVAQVFHVGNLEDLTVRRIRLATEKALGIEKGFFRNGTQWKAKSDQIIKDEVEAQARAQQGNLTEAPHGDVPSTPDSVKRPPRQETPARLPAVEDSPKPKKRRKMTTLSEPKEELSAPVNPIIDEEEKKPAGRAKVSPGIRTQQPLSTTTVLSELADAGSRPKTKQEATKTVETTEEVSESELSVLMDEEPKLKHKRPKSAGIVPTNKGRKKGMGSQDPNLDSDQVEIKRLQGWLVKCGIRKMWSRELAPYEAPKAKIRHLKQMLKDAGMEGRYSLDKARQIREERELKADLELVQEGARRWGTGSVDERSDGEKPRQRLTRGLRTLSFLGGDGEETD